MLNSHLLNENDTNELRQIKLCKDKDGRKFILFYGFMINVLFPRTANFDSYMRVKLSPGTSNQRAFVSEYLYSLSVLEKSEYEVLECHTLSDVSSMGESSDESFAALLEKKYGILLWIMKRFKLSFIFRNRHISSIWMRRVYVLLKQTKCDTNESVNLGRVCKTGSDMYYSAQMYEPERRKREQEQI